MEPEKPPKDKKPRYIAFAIIPFVLAVPPIVGWALGTYLDDYFATKPYLMYVFVVCGLVAAYREFFRIIKDFGE
ncbi:MAG: AtpZ/AtpI family protein [Chlamydiales bacterium]|nr:AtpZ/AtpI family protein [Chlamydiales bacterium]